MEEFASSVEDEALRNELLSAIHGRGAFQYFKYLIHRRGAGFQPATTAFEPACLSAPDDMSAG
jgi:hypothetical protein